MDDISFCSARVMAYAYLTLHVPIMILIWYALNDFPNLFYYISS